MSDKKVILLLSILFLMFIPLVSAANPFKIYTGESPESVCPASTALYIDFIENTGSSNLEFTISKSGSASSFATTVPQGFLLKPGKIKPIYTYITPRSTTPTGNYELKITVNSNQGSESVSHQVYVKDCYDYQIQSLENVKHVCPADSERFTLKLTNNGKFLDTYLLSVEGEYASKITLSESQFSLQPGTSKDVLAFAQTGPDDVGTHDFSIRVTPRLGRSIKTASANLIVDSCYDFNLETEKDFVELCENSQQTIPITIKNKGSTDNTFNLAIKGPEWSNLDKNKLEISQNSVGKLSLVLSPPYGTEGNFQIEFTAESEKGNIKALNIFNINVKKCHSINIDIEKDSDRICNSLENTYAVTLRNDGQFEKDYIIEIDAPDWAAINKRTLRLAPGQEDSLTLSVNPPFNVIPASYSIDIKATAADSDKITDTDKITLSTVTKEECFQAAINLENKGVELPYDSTTTLPVVIENRGAYTATYDITLTGTASSFAYLNPSILTIEPSKSEIVYLYIAPTGEVSNGDYSITISARLREGAILATETLNIKVVESKAPTLEETTREQIETQTESIFQKIINFFKRQFTPKEEIKNETSAEEEINESEQELIGELITKTTKLKEGEKEQFLINGEEHEIEFTEEENGVINLIVKSDKIPLNLRVGESRKIDLDHDGVYDLLVTLNGYVNGEADISYEKIEELVEDFEEDLNNNKDEEIDETLNDSLGITEDREVKSKGANFLSQITNTVKPLINNITQFIVLYRNQIIGIILILLIILIAAKTKFHKKILKFFEEEIEEEPVIKEIKPVEEKKEEPAKKEKKKKEEKKPEVKEVKREEKKPEPKKEEKKDEDEEEDFIIEFDDEDEEK